MIVGTVVIAFLAVVFACATAAFNADVDCHLAPAVGTCRAFSVKYYYDMNDTVCKPFIYGGCGGNANRFANEEECNATCADWQDIRSFHLPTTTAPPETEAPDLVPICLLSPEPGNCSGITPRNPGTIKYFFNSDGYCQPFIYCGIGGNANRFDSDGECLLACLLTVPNTATTTTTTTTTPAPDAHRAPSEQSNYSEDVYLQLDYSCANVEGTGVVIWTQSTHDCAFQCSATENCLFFNYNSKGGTCVLFANCPEESPDKSDGSQTWMRS